LFGRLNGDAGLMHLVGFVDLMVWLIWDGLILLAEVDGFD